MSAPVLKLHRNLRRQVLRGHPWIYKEAFESLPPVPVATLAKVVDRKDEFLCWGMLDSHSPIALRVISVEEKFSQKTIENKLEQAYKIRSHITSDYTDAYRLVNGEGDFLPGLVCDVYAGSAVIQYDGQGPREFWQTFPIARKVIDLTKVDAVYIKPRGKDGSDFRRLIGKVNDTQPTIKENNCKFTVDIEQGQKTGFFLDQRENRKYLAGISRGQRVINLFSYTGGFSVYAGRGKADKVVSVDISEKATSLAEKNWLLNNLPGSKHESLCVNVFDYLQSESEKWDVVIVDPPSMAHSEEQKEGATKKYTELFSQAARRVTAGGDLLLSSCSSHISFPDFYEICVEALSKARKRGQVLNIAGQGRDHPFPLACPEMRYLKFFHLRVD